MSSLSKMFNLITSKCPVCKSRKLKKYSFTYKNRYSEMVSDFFKVAEAEVLKNYFNYICEDCKFIFKGVWPQNLFWRRVYNSLIPIHPKGWDKLSNDFSKNKFLLYCLSFFKKNNLRQREILKRKILSILEASNFAKINRKKFINFKNSIQIENVNQIKKSYIFISKNLNKPKDFSRFRGFGNDYLLNIIEKKIGKVKIIAEVGCPLWGFLDIPTIEKKYFLRLDSHIFWGENCKKNNNKCYKKLDENTSVLKVNDFFKKKIKVDLFVAFLVLDHLTDPVKFFKQMLKTSTAVAIILEDPTDNDRKGIAVQHYSAWTKNFFMNFSKKYDKKVFTDIKDIENLGNNFYLLY